MSLAENAANFALGKIKRNPLAETLEKRRLAKGLSKYALCSVAAVDYSVYKKILTGQTRRPQRATLDRLDRALDGLPAAPRHLPVEAIAGLHRQALHAVAAARRRLAVGEVMDADFTRQRPKNREWLEAARCRRLAMYLVVTGHNIPAAELARALGVSRQAVGQAVTAVEDLREDPRLDRLLERVAARLIG